MKFQYLQQYSKHFSLITVIYVLLYLLLPLSLLILLDDIWIFFIKLPFVLLISSISPVFTISLTFLFSIHLSMCYQSILLLLFHCLFFSGACTLVWKCFTLEPWLIVLQFQVYSLILNFSFIQNSII